MGEGVSVFADNADEGGNGDLDFGKHANMFFKSSDKKDGIRPLTAPPHIGP